MKIPALIKHAARNGVFLSVENGQLKFKLSVQTFPADLKQTLIERKDDLVEFLDKDRKTVDRAKRSVIVPRDSNLTDIPVSFAQQRLWFIDQMQNGSLEYNMPIALKIVGRFDVDAAQIALSRIVDRHESLRTTFFTKEGAAFQRVSQSFDFTINRVDLASLSLEEKERSLSEFIEKERLKKFDLARDLMIRASYLHLTNLSQPGYVDGDVLLFSTHHIASDGWSMGLMLEEFVKHYQTVVSGRQDPMPKLAIQYADYALWQQGYLADSVLQKQIDYWKARLRDLPAVHTIPLDYELSEQRDRIAGTVSCSLDHSIAAPFMRLAHRYKLTPFMLMHSALALVLSRHGNSTDIIVGTPVANRLHAELKPLIGFFANTLVLRVNTAHDSLADYLDHVRAINVEAQANQDIPFEKLVEHCLENRSVERSPLFQILFAMNNNKQAELNLSDVQFSSLGSAQNFSKFELDVSAIVDDHSIQMAWTFDTGLFTQDHVKTMSEHLCELIKSMVANPQLPIQELNSLPESEYQYLVDTLNDTKTEIEDGVLLHELVELSVARDPEATAIVFGGATLTYGALNAQANQMARHLQSMGVGADHIVGICTERSAHMITSILAILKSGGAYLPLDPALPYSRMEHMLEDSGCKVLLCQNHLTDQFQDLSVEVINIDSSSLFIKYSDANLVLDVGDFSPSQLAYVIYTSGSSGKPKGVMIDHRAIALHVRIWSEYLELKSRDRIIQFASISFDGAPESIFSTLTAGAAMYVREQDVWSVDAFYQFCVENQITLADLPPAYCLQLMIDPDSKIGAFWRAPPLRTLVLGGDALNQEIVAIWNTFDSPCRLLNAYGPTETTVTATIYELDNHPDDLAIPIGKALPERVLYILDSQGQLMPRGAVGELFIGGRCLARGYLNQPEQTAKSFIDNPFGPGKLFRSGDQVQLMADGNLAFLGRVDNQVKIRGFRIEPSEVQHVLSGCDGVASALVVVKPDSHGDNQLLAYVILEPNHTWPSNASSIDLSYEMSLKLPAHMIPSCFVEMAKWPLTLQGKIDQTALPPVTEELLHGEYQSAETPNEHVLVKIWAKLLSKDESKLSVVGDFFTLGGHSLLLVRLISEIKRETSVSFDLRQAYVAPTIKKLAELIDYYQVQQDATEKLTEDANTVVERSEF